MILGPVLDASHLARGGSLQRWIGLRHWGGVYLGNVTAQPLLPAEPVWLGYLSSRSLSCPSFSHENLTALKRAC